MGYTDRIMEFDISIILYKISSKWNEDINVHMFAIRDMQIKTTFRFYFITVGMTIITKTHDNKFCQGQGERESFFMVRV